MLDYCQESDELSSMYNLYGISRHSGDLHSGHYICDVYSNQQNCWYSCDDTSVQHIDQPNTRSGSAYVMFYMNQQQVDIQLNQASTLVQTSSNDNEIPSNQ